MNFGYYWIRMLISVRYVILWMKSKWRGCYTTHTHKKDELTLFLCIFWYLIHLKYHKCSPQSKTFLIKDPTQWSFRWIFVLKISYNINHQSAPTAPFVWKRSDISVSRQHKGQQQQRNIRITFDISFNLLINLANKPLLEVHNWALIFPQYLLNFKIIFNQTCFFLYIKNSYHMQTETTALEASSNDTHGVACGYTNGRK